MNKQQLIRMPALEATDEMMHTAQSDVPSKEKSKWGPRYGTETYTYKLYLRCCVESDILKAAFFLPHLMRTGGRQPAYELYVCKGQETFLTYDRIADKWLTAKLDRIHWPAYSSYSDGVWYSQTDADAVSEYLGEKDNPYSAILRYQRGIRDKELIRRHKKTTDPWDADLKQTPKLPKDWERWLRKVAIPIRYMYYHYKKGGAKTGYCTFCEKEVPIQQPRNNKIGKCPRCHHEVIYKAVGKAGTVYTGSFYAYLIQRCKDGFMIREFEVSQTFRKGQYKTPSLHQSEIRRTIYDSRFAPRSYYWDWYKQREVRWIACSPCSSSYGGDQRGKTYGKTLPHLAKNQLKETGLVDWIKAHAIADPEKYMAVFQEVPVIEKTFKANLRALTDELYSGGRYSEFGKYFAPHNSLIKALKIDARQFKRFREMDGRLFHLSWFQYEKATGKDIPPDVMEWFWSNRIHPAELKFIDSRMTPLQIRNYIQRQMTELNVNCRTVMGWWADYLSMAARLKMDVNDEIIYRVRKLKQRHDELVELCNQKKTELRAEEIAEKFPRVNGICVGLKDKFEYRGKGYAVVSPTCILDILEESEALHHCAGSSDRYWERIEQNESYILFLRKTSNIHKPYYTLEVEPDGTVRQTRTTYDRQNADIEKAKAFLAKWQKVIAGRLTSEDRTMAETSKTLRLEEFAELREKNAIIHTGEFAGQKLVDVLAADLMVNQAA